MGEASPNVRGNESKYKRDGLATYSIQPNLNTISLPLSQVIFPSEVLFIPLPQTCPVASHISISPSFPDAYECASCNPQVCSVINGHALYKNTSDTSLVSPSYAHFKPHPVLIMNLTDVIPDQTLTSIKSKISKFSSTSV